MSAVHATAIVDPQARFGEGVEIGPYSIVGPDVELGDGVILHSHVVVAGRAGKTADQEIVLGCGEKS